MPFSQPKQVHILIPRHFSPKIVVARFGRDVSDSPSTQEYSPFEHDKIVEACPFHLNCLRDFVCSVMYSQHSWRQPTGNSEFYLCSLANESRSEILSLLGKVEYMLNFLKPRKMNGIVYFFHCSNSDDFERILRDTESHILFLLKSIHYQSLR